MVGGGFFELLDESLAEAIRSAELSKRDRQQWQRDLETWQAEIDNYGIDDGFAMSLAALGFPISDIAKVRSRTNFLWSVTINQIVQAKRPRLLPHES